MKNILRQKQYIHLNAEDNMLDNDDFNMLISEVRWPNLSENTTIGENSLQFMPEDLQIQNIPSG